MRINPRKVAKAVSGSVLVASIAFAAFLSADSTVVLPRGTDMGDTLRQFVLPVFPQAWPFFTKPADDSELTAFVVSEDSITNATDFPNSLPSNAFGFSRTQRAQGPGLYG